MKRTSCFLYLLVATLSLLCSSCNTVRGLGEDISGSANFMQKKMCGDDAAPPSASSNPPQWPK